MHLPSNIKYLAIEGVIGVGKSTLVKYLSRYFNCQALYEDFANNPFLSEFYKDRSNYAFQTQIVFLLSRHKQIKELFGQQNLFSGPIISDYIFAKDQIFASLNLDENELALYNKLLPMLEKDLVKPDYVVYLQANVDVLMERIHQRDRTFERNIEESYIQSLIEYYNSFFMHYTESPVLIVNCNDLDFVRNNDDLEFLIQHICKAPDGTNFLSPIS